MCSLFFNSCPVWSASIVLIILNVLISIRSIFTFWFKFSQFWELILSYSYLRSNITMCWLLSKSHSSVVNFLFFLTHLLPCVFRVLILIKIITQQHQGLLTGGVLLIISSILRSLLFIWLIQGHVSPIHLSLLLFLLGTCPEWVFILLTRSVNIEIVLTFEMLWNIEYMLIHQLRKLHCFLVYYVHSFLFSFWCVVFVNLGGFGFLVWFLCLN